MGADRSARQTGTGLGIALGLSMAACGGHPVEDMSWMPDGPQPSSQSDPSGEVEPEPCDDVCANPPSECHEPTGTCEDSFCSYPPKLAGEICEEDCVGGGFCDASGNCICTSNACEATCTAGPNATATCDAEGECVRTCDAPWENCDGDWSNGCEVPVGITGVCDAGGLNLDGGCFTAYCGQSAAPDTHNFDTYYCVSCSTCNAPSAGMCRWCNRDTGNWYGAESCDCGGHLDLACDPG
jgi:hypothetical protein